MGRVLQKRRGSHQAPITDTMRSRENTISSQHQSYDQNNNNNNNTNYHNHHNRGSESGPNTDTIANENHNYTNSTAVHVHSHTNSVTGSITHGATSKSAHVIPDSTTNVSSLSEQATAKEDEDPMRLYVCFVIISYSFLVVFAPTKKKTKKWFEV